MRQVWLALVCALLTPAVGLAQESSDSIAAHVADAVCAQQVVLLGELPSHGEARAFEIKAKVVQRLIERCGFDAVLFEAPIYDFIGFTEGGPQHRSTAEQLDRAIGRFWLTQELAAWRRWLFLQAASGKTMVGGLDDQVSVTSEYARATLPSLVASSSSPERAAECAQAVERHLYWRYDAATPFDEPEQNRLQRCTSEAAARSDRAGRASDVVMLENLANHVGRQRDARAAMDRDEAMCRNATWHFERLPPASKVVIWTSTVHASREQGALRHQPLGARLAATFGQKMASVGFTAVGGMSSMAGRPAKALPEAPPGSLEARAIEGHPSWVVLDAAALAGIGRVPSRLLGTLAEADWTSFFDLVVVVREEAAPTFGVWK